VEVGGVLEDLPRVKADFTRTAVALAKAREYSLDSSVICNKLYQCYWRWWPRF
jgi:hypothetical protein